MDRSRESTLPSPAQEELWLLSQLAGDVPIGNQPITIRRRGGFEMAALEEALAALVRRHDAWRTTVCADGGRVASLVGSSPAVALSVVDLRGIAGAELQACVLATSDAARPFDLERGPLFRARLVRVGADDDRLYLTIHRALGDSAAVHRVLLPELAGLYDARIGRGPEPPPPTLTYEELARRRGAWLHSAAAARQLEYWRRRLAGPPPRLELVPDRARPVVRGFGGARHRVALDAGLTGAVRLAAAKETVSVEVFLLAAFLALLHRHTGEEDAVVGVMTSGRTSLELDRLLGCLANPVALRVDLGDDPSFRTLLARVRAEAEAATDNGGVPFAHVVKAVQPLRDRGRAPLFSNLFTFEPLGPGEPPGWTLDTFEIDPGTAEVDVHLMLVERGDTLDGVLTYRTDLFEPSTIERLQRQLHRLLEAAVADLDCPVSRLALLDEDERHRLVVERNRTARPYPADVTLHELVARQATGAPDRIALVAGDATLTYGELDRRADALAGRLRALGVRPGAIVGIAMERSPEVIVGYLAALKAGGAYLPLSVTDPRERLAFMVKDAGVSVVVTRAADASLVAGLGAPVLEIDRARDDDEPVDDGRPPVTADDLAYVIYTSGSTGRPKGVAVPHRGVVRLLFGQEGYVRLGPDEVILQSTALSFDVSVFEIWGALVHGARLVLYPSAVPTARELRNVIRRHGVTTMWLTPSIFNVVIDEDPECLAPLRQLDLGGEALSVSHVAHAAALLRETRITNGYGPTECSVSATAYVVPAAVDPMIASIPIGRPIANTTTYVLDRHLDPVPIGVPGELCLGGPGLARGYVNRPEETAARFVPHPFDPTPGARIYRTGDLARWRPDGALEYLGRLDSQVKIRGLRIELGEIEAVLERHPDVREAAVVVRGQDAASRLVACVVVRPGAAVRADELREHVRRAVPMYMVPAAFLVLDTLPLTANGKVDRRALVALADAPAHEPEPAVAAPSGSLEAQLADLWQGLLGGRPIGVHDDFFELGGDSLTAARMIQQVSDLTGCALPLTTLYEHPTVGELARLLRRRGEREFDVTAPAVTLNRGGDRTPLFLFHGMLTGGAFYALRLARRLGPRQPVHVVHPFTGVTAPVPSTIEGMVDEHIRVVRALQPQGPYRLAGYCNGGLVAYEIARRLQESGDTVELLALIAAAPATPLAATGRLVQRAAELAGLSPERTAEPVARLRSFVEALTALPPRARPAFVAAKGAALARRAARRSTGRPSAFTPGVMDLYHRIVMRYFAQRYAGAVVLLWPEREPWGSAAAAASAWRRLVPAVSVHVVPGDHLAVVHEHLDVLAEHLASYLEEGRRPADVAAAVTVGLRLGVPPVLMNLAEVLHSVAELAVRLA
jgi:amino acid adenylation domain-containing protein